MNKVSTAILFIAITSLLSCNNSGDKQRKDMSQSHENAMHDSSNKQNENIKEILPTFTSLDSKVAASFKSIIDKYIDIKNALAANDESVSQSNAKELQSLLSSIDKSLLTPQQKKIYESEEGDLIENAEHIGKSKIDHQREHFSMLSQSMYVIARSFGGGRSLYHLFCSKAVGSDGAMWISESNDSNNPYLGNASCSEVIEKIK